MGVGIMHKPLHCFQLRKIELEQYTHKDGDKPTHTIFSLVDIKRGLVESSVRFTMSSFYIHSRLRTKKI